jgi:hypothetical protein
VAGAPVLADDFRIWFAATRPAADELTGPDGLADYVARFRAGRARPTFGTHRELIVDSARQRVAFTWTGAMSPDRSAGGIEGLFQLPALGLLTAMVMTAERTVVIHRRPAQ